MSMGIAFIVTLGVLNWQVLTGYAGNSVRILPEANHVAPFGTNVTLTCVISGDIQSYTLVKWIFRTVTVTWCDSRNLSSCAEGAMDFEKCCSFTINPVDVSSEGLYQCELYSAIHVPPQNLRLIVAVPYSTLDMLDLSTGKLVGSNASCIPSDTKQFFQCTFRETKPSVWRITWLLGDGGESSDVPTYETPSRGGLVDVRSNLTVSSWPNEHPKKNLTCRATGHEKDQHSVSVELILCPAIDPNSSIALLDLWSGELVDSRSGPVCISAGTGRSFECTVRQTKPGVWNFTWIMGNTTEVVRVTGMTSDSSGELVNVSSRFNVSNFKLASSQQLICLATRPGESLRVAVELRSRPDPVPNTTMDLYDLSTGHPVDSSSGSICLPSGRKRTFECTVREAEPGVWSIAWIIGDLRLETAQVNEKPVTEDFVDLSSTFTVSNRPYEDLIKSLTCRATSVEGETFSIRVQIQSCSGDDLTRTTDNTFLVAAVTFGSAVLVVLTMIAVRCKTTCAEPQGIQTAPTAGSPVEMPSLTPSGSSDTSQEPTGYEVMITTPEIDSVTGQDSGLPSWAERWAILWSDLVVDDHILGRGNFGEVRSGAVRMGGELVGAAIKMLKGHVSRDDREDFMDEFWTMTSIGYHPNIVSLLGACQHQGVLYVALEYLPHGDLRSYLRTARSQSASDEDTLSSGQLVEFAFDIAKGMEHLARAGVIHRDLAARNILLGEGLIAKVSDFGLSRGEDIYVQTSRRRVPIRWLAIESVKYQTYTTQSDVWSFGIVLWEIATFGATPYSSIRNELLAATLKRGYRMPKPDNCDEQIYALMRQCWAENPNDRPTFAQLVSVVSEMADNRIKHTYMAVVRDQHEDVDAIRPELDDD